jgi:hypothetical protein
MISVLWLIVVYINNDMTPSLLSMLVLITPVVNFVMCIILTKKVTCEKIKKGVIDAIGISSFKEDIKRVRDEKLSSN